MVSSVTSSSGLRGTRNRAHETAILGKAGRGAFVPRPLITQLTSPGSAIRIAFALYLVLDRYLNADRERQIVITSIRDIDPYAAFQIYWTLGIAALVVMYLVGRMSIAIRRINFETAFVFLAAYIALACLSSLWSGSELLTLFKAGQCLIYMLGIQCALVGLPTLGDRVRYVLALALIYLLISYFTFFTVDINVYGFNMTGLHFVVGAVPFAGFFFLARLSELGKFGKIFQLILLFFTVIETVFTMWVALIVAEFSNFIYKHRNISRLAAIVFVLAALVAFILLLPTGDNATILGVKKVDDIENGSGRFAAWGYALFTGFPEHPLLGHGFVTGDSIARDRGINAALGQLHNSVLSSLLNLGIVGFILFGMFMLGMFRMVMTHPRTEFRRLAIACMIVVVLAQMAGGASVSSMMHPVWISHTLFFTILAIEELTVTRPTRKFRSQ